MNDALAELLRHPALWRGGDAGAPETVPTGFRALDARLPGGGWPLATLIELLVPAAGVGEIRLLLPALRRLTTAVGEEPRWVAWLAPPHLPYAPALADAGLDPARMLSYGVSADAVNNQLRAMNVDLPGGQAESGNQEEAEKPLIIHHATMTR